MKRVLWLASWYPNKLSPFDGDFLQRHARAVSLFCALHVIYIVKDETGKITKDEKTETTVNGNLSEQIIYYASPKTGLKLLDRFLSHRKYRQLYQQAINGYVEKNGKPALSHVQIALRAGLGALWMKKKWNIPYVVSEQWTGYLAAVDFGIKNYSGIQKKWLRQILEEADAVTVVSDHLGKAIRQYFPLVNYRVIPNVVDTDIFFPVPKHPTGVVKLIHISNMNYQKNTEAILAALRLLKNQVSFSMQLYGTVNPVLQQLISDLQLRDNVMMMGEVPQPQLAKAIQQSDALVLYSRYETFGCVLIEANACGVPVIVSDIEVFHELIKENENGMFAKENDPSALAEKIKAFIQQKNSFDQHAIAETTAGKYNFKRVGRQFMDLYAELSS